MKIDKETISISKWLMLVSTIIFLAFFIPFGISGLVTFFNPPDPATIPTSVSSWQLALVALKYYLIVMVIIFAGSKISERRKKK